jgi:hypothetical protein
MRLWTIHPCYLDAKGLVALWRESLLAQKVLQGKTKGYRHHPQLNRFRVHPMPAAAIALYLSAVLEEAKKRNYHFDENKIPRKRTRHKIKETEGQLLYEWRHLKRKLKKRNYTKYLEIRSIINPEAHPFFHIVRGKVQDWERVK